MPISIFGDPGTQGATVAGIHGIGVNTPKAAAVAAATIGLASELHIPKGRIFKNGLLSIILAKGVIVITLFRGRTISEPGAMPKEHYSIEPVHTSKPIIIQKLL